MQTNQSWSISGVHHNVRTGIESYSIHVCLCSRVNRDQRGGQPRSRPQHIPSMQHRSTSQAAVDSAQEEEHTAAGLTRVQSLKRYLGSLNGRAGSVCTTGGAAAQLGCSLAGLLAVCAAARLMDDSEDEEELLLPITMLS